VSTPTEEATKVIARDQAQDDSHAQDRDVEPDQQQAAG
jgi:hypothetical protein